MKRSLGNQPGFSVRRLCLTLMLTFPVLAILTALRDEVTCFWLMLLAWLLTILTFCLKK
jgi:hypothetical protein